MDQQSAIYVNFTVMLVAALVGGLIANRFKQPLILGYLIIGVAIGPYALGLVSDTAIVEASANIGVALLMLTLGLEFSLGQIRQVGKVALIGGFLQIGLTIVIGIFAAFFLLGWTLSQAILFGLIISLSSTMVCMKILMDRGELDSVHGRIMMAILILQDILAVVMIIVVPLMGHTDENIWLALLRTFGSALVFIAIAIVFGIWILPWLMGNVGGVRTRELFLLSVLVLCLVAALSTSFLGLSTVFGAFLVGMILRETSFAHQALAEITPLRDIFAALFFVSLGMLLDPQYVLNNWALVLMTVVIIIAIKFFVIFGIIRFFKYGTGVAVFAGFGLFQIGEFSFIIAQSGVHNNIISQNSYTLIIASAVITMLLTPFAIGLAGRFHPHLSRVNIVEVTPESVKKTRRHSAAGIHSQVIVAGLGRVGQNIARGLQGAAITFSAVEIGPGVALRTDCGDAVCIYGDASNMHVLSLLNLKKAELLVVTYPDPVAVLTTVKSALSINPELKIVARAHRESDAERLRKLGVTNLVSPEYEASLEFVRQILLLSGKGKTDIKETMDQVLQDEEFEAFETKEDDHYEPWM